MKPYDTKLGPRIFKQEIKSLLRSRRKERPLRDVSQSEPSSRQQEAQEAQEAQEVQDGRQSKTNLQARPYDPVKDSLNH